MRESRTVDIDFVKVVGVGSAFAIGKEDLVRVVMNVGVANATRGIVEQDAQFACFDIQPTEPSAVAKCVPHAVRLDKCHIRIARLCLAVVSEISVPMVASRYALGEDNLIATHQLSVDSRLPRACCTDRQHQRQSGQEDQARSAERRGQSMFIHVLHACESKTR